MKGWDNETTTRYRGGVLFMAGFAALAAGALVYLLDRSADAALFPPAILSLHDGRAYLAPMAGGSLPSFLHSMAFALMTAALLGPGIRRSVLACAAWAAIDILFEISQHPLFAKSLGVGMAGTFDPLDISAALFGAVAAFGVTWKYGAREGKIS